MKQPIWTPFWKWDTIGIGSSSTFKPKPTEILGNLLWSKYVMSTYFKCKPSFENCWQIIQETDVMNREKPVHKKNWEISRVAMTKKFCRRFVKCWRVLHDPYESSQSCSLVMQVNIVCLRIYSTFTLILLWIHSDSFLLLLYFYSDFTVGKNKLQHQFIEYFIL